MLTIVSGAFHEKLTVKNNEIILNGPPGDLRGHIRLRNHQDEAIKVRSLAFSHDDQGTNGLSGVSSLRIAARLQPGEEKLETIRHEVHSQTPPGIYDSTLEVGGELRKIRMIVQQHIEISIFPASFTFQGSEPGTTHTAAFTLTNLGNMPFQVPDIKHIAALDMDLLCKAFGIAFRDKKAAGFEQVMDALTKTIKDNLADWARLSIDEKMEVVAPGDSRLIHLNITLPGNCDASNDYSGSIRFWEKEISYLVKSNTHKKY